MQAETDRQLTEFRKLFPSQTAVVQFLRNREAVLAEQYTELFNKFTMSMAVKLVAEYHIFNTLLELYERYVEYPGFYGCSDFNPLDTVDSKQITKINNVIIRMCNSEMYNVGCDNSDSCDNCDNTSISGHNSTTVQNLKLQIAEYKQAEKQRLADAAREQRKLEKKKAKQLEKRRLSIAKNNESCL